MSSVVHKWLPILLGDLARRPGQFAPSAAAWVITASTCSLSAKRHNTMAVPKAWGSLRQDPCQPTPRWGHGTRAAVRAEAGETTG